MMATNKSLSDLFLKKKPNISDENWSTFFSCSRKDFIEFIASGELNRSVRNNTLSDSQKILVILMLCQICLPLKKGSKPWSEASESRDITLLRPDDNTATAQLQDKIKDNYFAIHASVRNAPNGADLLESDMMFQAFGDINSYSPYIKSTKKTAISQRNFEENFKNLLTLLQPAHRITSDKSAMRNEQEELAFKSLNELHKELIDTSEKKDSDILGSQHRLTTITNQLSLDSDIESRKKLLELQLVFLERGLPQTKVKSTYLDEISAIKTRLAANENLKEIEKDFLAIIQKLKSLSAQSWNSPEGGITLWTNPLPNLVQSISTRAELVQNHEQEQARAEQEKDRAEQEKDRAEQEKDRAEQEKDRAEQEKDRVAQERVSFFKRPVTFIKDHPILTALIISTAVIGGLFSFGAVPALAFVIALGISSGALFTHSIGASLPKKQTEEDLGRQIQTSQEALPEPENTSETGQDFRRQIQNSQETLSQSENTPAQQTALKWPPRIFQGMFNRQSRNGATPRPDRSKYSNLG